MTPPHPRFRASPVLATMACILSCSAEPNPASPERIERVADAAPQANPLVTLQPPDPDRATFHGRVRERIAAGGYTYLAVRTDAGDLHWVVTTSEVPSTPEIEVRSMGEASDFRSRRLDRTFASLTFGSVRER